MDLIKIDPLHSQPFERPVARLNEVIARRIVGNAQTEPTLELYATFRAQDHAVSKGGFVFENLAEERLSSSPRTVVVEAINVSSVNQGHPGIERRCDALGGDVDVDASKSPASEGNCPDGQAARSKCAFFHAWIVGHQCRGHPITDAIKRLRKPFVEGRGQAYGGD